MEPKCALINSFSVLSMVKLTKLCLVKGIVPLQLLVLIDIVFLPYYGCQWGSANEVNYPFNSGDSFTNLHK